MTPLCEAPSFGTARVHHDWSNARLVDPGGLRFTYSIMPPPRGGAPQIRHDDRYDGIDDRPPSVTAIPSAFTARTLRSRAVLE